MDLNFIRLERSVAVTAMPVDLAVMMVGITARQAASPTARLAMRLARTVMATAPLAPVDGAFHGATASALSHFREV